MIWETLGKSVAFSIPDPVGTPRYIEVRIKPCTVRFRFGFLSEYFCIQVVLLDNVNVLSSGVKLKINKLHLHASAPYLKF